MTADRRSLLVRCSCKNLQDTWNDTDPRHVTRTTEGKDYNDTDPRNVIWVTQTPAMPFGTLNWNRQPRNPNDVDLRHAHSTAKSWTGLIKTKPSEYTRDKVPFHGSEKEMSPSQYGLERYEIYLYTLLLSNTACLDRYS